MNLTIFSFCIHGKNSKTICGCSLIIQVRGISFCIVCIYKLHLTQSIIIIWIKH